MAWDIRWDLLGKAKDPGQSFSEGVEEGRARADQTAQRGALSVLAGDPSNTEALGVLTSINPQVGLAYQTNALKQAEVARATHARELGADYVAQNMGGSGVLGSPPSMSSTTGGGEDIAVTAPPRAPVSIADVYRADPDAADGLIKTVGAWSEQQKKQAAAEADALAVAAFAARKRPYAERQAVIDTYRPMLTQAGWSQKEIDDFDPTDDALEGSITHSLGVKEAMTLHARELAAAEVARHNRASEGTSSANLAVSRARLGLAEKREGRIAKWGPQPLFGAVPTSTDDLDY